MKNLVIILFAFMAINVFGQELPEVIPPSPTVANLMQFEEVPVSHYTGQPNISIPLYSKAISNELGINIALSYNTQGIKINNRSSWVGTGWSLEAGGVISRTVRGVADEKPKGNTNYPGNSKATGVFHNDDYWNYNDPLLSVDKSKFAWRANGAQDDQYDYESDLFQFNALGVTGRFVIVKEGTLLVPKLLTKNQNVKIEIDYGLVHTFSLDAFTIIDTKGNRYTFDKIEEVYSDPFTAVEYFGGNQSYQGQGTNGKTTNAWYLSKIETSNLKELARFDYQVVTENYVASINRTYREIDSDNIISSPPLNWNNMVQNPYNPTVLPPKVSISYYTTTAHTQKLSKITFRDSTRVEFVTDASHPETGGVTLKDIIIKDANLVENKRFSFNHDDTQNIERLWLMSVNEKSGLNTHPYTFNYIDKEALPPFDTESDAWGYNNGMDNLNFNSSCNATNPFDKDVIKKGLLSSIEYPTGGVKEFIFEHNTITYQSKIGALGTQGTSNDTIAVALADNYYQKYNTDNWIIADPVPFTINSDNDNYAQGPPYPQAKDFTLPLNTQIVFNINNMNVDLSLCGTGDTEENVLFNSLIKIIGTNVNYETNIRLSNLEQDQLILNLSAGTYEIQFYMLNNCAQVTFDMCYNDITYEPIISRFIYGGGVRIKDIIFKDDNDVNTLPSKKVSFAYNDELDPTRSSGAIDGDINGMNLAYVEEVTKHLFNNEYTCEPNLVEEFKLFFNVFTKGLNVELTQGSYVGYKTVSVSEENNGFTRYTFTSPQDYANQTEVFEYPQLPPKNLDFKRGLLLKKRVYKHNSTQQAPGAEPLGKLMETENTYKFVEEVLAPSFRLYTTLGCPWAMYFNTYDEYVSSTGSPQNRLMQCFGTVSGCDGDCFTTVIYQQKVGCTNTPYYLIQNPVESGWAQLKETKSTEYFYDEQDVQTSSTESRQEFVYNDDNFQIKEQKSFYEEKGVEQEYRTEFVYPVDGLLITSNYGSNAIWNRLVDLNKINEVVITKNYKNTSLLSTSYTKYDEDIITNPDQVLPSSIETFKGANVPDARIEFHKYDDYGNPLEVSKKSGTHIMYVWGYNDTKPIAKIVNHSCLGIASSLQNAIDEAILASNNDIDEASEDVLKEKLDAIRNHSELVDAQVTIMTYDPLVGITSVTDARGYSMTYHYDPFNRLDHVKDDDGNILSENEYNYKNQY